VILLNKFDLADDTNPAGRKNSVHCREVPVVSLSALSKTGLDALNPYTQAGGNELHS
jgi:ribosome biogenesis GTPase